MLFPFHNISIINAVEPLSILHARPDLAARMLDHTPPGSDSQQQQHQQQPDLDAQTSANTIANETGGKHGCQMAIARFLAPMCLALRAS